MESAVAARGRSKTDSFDVCDFLVPAPGAGAGTLSAAMRSPGSVAAEEATPQRRAPSRVFAEGVFGDGHQGVVAQRRPSAPHMVPHMAPHIDSRGVPPAVASLISRPRVGVRPFFEEEDEGGEQGQQEATREDHDDEFSGAFSGHFRYARKRSIFEPIRSSSGGRQQDDGSGGGENDLSTPSKPISAPSTPARSRRRELRPFFQEDGDSSNSDEEGSDAGMFTAADRLYYPGSETRHSARKLHTMTPSTSSFSMATNSGNASVRHPPWDAHHWRKHSRDRDAGSGSSPSVSANAPTPTTGSMPRTPQRNLRNGEKLVHESPMELPPNATRGSNNNSSSSSSSSSTTTTTNIVNNNNNNSGSLRRTSNGGMASSASPSSRQQRDRTTRGSPYKSPAAAGRSPAPKDHPSPYEKGSFKLRTIASPSPKLKPAAQSPPLSPMQTPLTPGSSPSLLPSAGKKSPYV